MSIALELLTHKKRRKVAKLQRAYKACFCSESGEISAEGRLVLADLRERAMMFDTSIKRTIGGSIDKDLLLEIEGRRAIVLRVLNVLELDPLGVAAFSEVSDE